MRGMAWILLATLACSGGLEGAEESARAALTSGDYAGAMQQANVGLEAAKSQGDRPAIWRFEMVILESWTY